MTSPRLFAVIAVFALAACDPIDRSPLGPGQNGEASDTTGALRMDPSVARELRDQQRHLLRHEYAVNFAHGTATMWAVRGESRTMKLQYGDGSPFATFTVGAGTLVTDAAGSEVAPGDSVEITMRLLQPSTFAVDMQPSGIRFNPDAPAVLQFNLDRAGRNAMRSQNLSFWKQETTSSPWEPVPATFDYVGRTATASLSGFTIYAIID